MIITVKYHNLRPAVKCEKRQVEPLKVKGTHCRKVRKLNLGIYYKVRLYGICLYYLFSLTTHNYKPLIRKSHGYI